ncbi:hypothetical protein K227x_41540 [Rubripirellula lacrimiformis]|uniref:Uncharacterized protein n=1 Tax=Rubripirellula lacrimiformis TaxID=1930273 RepID=A0A517NF37_9BACT|nr:hypothetical protein K227x_41540 [Rubripirellula lacrimiformis]
MRAAFRGREALQNPLAESFALAPHLLWRRNCSGAATALAPQLLWRRNCPGAATALAPQLLWRPICSGNRFAQVTRLPK